MTLKRATAMGLLGAVAALAFIAGVLLSDTVDDVPLLGPQVSLADRVVSLRMRVAAVERENDNLRTELWVRSALTRSRLDLGPDETDQVVSSLLEAHNRYEIPTEVLLAVIKAESDFDVDAVSSAGAIGLMQIMPATAQEVARDLNIPWTGKDMLTDPSINIQLGSEYLHRMFRRFGHADNALAAYNAGPRRVEGMNLAGILPRSYAGRVRRSMEQLAR